MRTARFGSVVAATLLWLWGSACHAGEEPANAPSGPAAVTAETPASASPSFDRADVETWLDGFLPYALQEADIAGAVVVVIKDRQVLLQKGYGYADVEKRLPMDPERTVIRPGSIGKLFTWTAVMQQVEQGRIDLDRDINDYLDFEIPATYAEPITMRHLLTHTPGFEEPLKGLFYDSPERLPDLGTYLRERLPARIFPPGKVPAYSNYGTALAGYIVQRVSGEDFHDYLERHIFEPLGMRDTSSRQPLPEHLAARLAESYDLASGGTPNYYRLVGPWPAGTMATTAADMARFMIAHLQMASGETGGLLQPQTAHLMHTTVTRALPSLNGFTLGFFQSDRNGRRVISHGGDLPGFHSDMNLLPDEGAGLFVSYNSSGEGEASLALRMALFERFMDRYFPTPLPEEPTQPTALEHGRLLAAAGPYEVSRRAETSFFAFGQLLGQMSVEVEEDGTLVVPAAFGLNGEPKKWREVAPFVWREVGGKYRLAAEVVDGQVRSFGLEPWASVLLFQPVPAIRSATWNRPLLYAAVTVLVLTVISWPVTAIVRWRLGVPFRLQGREAHAYRASRIVALIHLVFLFGWMMLVMADDSAAAIWDGRLDGRIRLLHLLGLAVVAGAGIAIWHAWLTWRRASELRARLWSAALALSCVAIVWLAFNFNLLTMSVSY